MRHGMAQSFFQIAQDKEANAELIANLDDVLVGFGKKRKLEQDNLSDVVLANDVFELIAFPEHGNSHVVDLIVVREQTDRAQTDLGFALQPLPQLRCALAGTDEQRFIFAAKNSPRQNRRKIVMREEQGDVEPRNEVEQKDTRNERVLGRDQIKHQQTNASGGFTQAEPMRAGHRAFPKQDF